MRCTAIGLSGALALALAASLAGCSSGESGSNASDKAGGGSGAGTTTGGGQDQPTPDNLNDDPQNSVAPVTLPSPKPMAAIPPAFRGRWGMVVTDCAPVDGAASKGLMVVSASTFQFRDGRASLGSLSAVGSDTLMAQLTYSAGGKTSRRVDRLTLVENGQTLVRQEQNLPASFRYSRCPA
jgi:hypothetical protein